MNQNLTSNAISSEAKPRLKKGVSIIKTNFNLVKIRQTLATGATDTAFNLSCYFVLNAENGRLRELSKIENDILEIIDGTMTVRQLKKKLSNHSIEIDGIKGLLEPLAGVFVDC